MSQSENGTRPTDSDENGTTPRLSAACDVGVVFSPPAASGGLLDLLSDVTSNRGSGFSARQGTLGGARVVLVKPDSTGAAAASAATEALISGHRPGWVIAAGFAAGLRPGLARGDLVMADSLTGSDGQRVAIDLKIDPAGTAGAARSHVGRIVTVDALPRRAEEKHRLGRETDALAADTIAYAVAEVCRERELRFMAVHVIRETVDDELPKDVKHVVEQKSTAGMLGAMTGAIFRRFSSVKDIWRLKEDSLIASDRLAKSLASTIAQLVTHQPRSENDA